MATKRGRGKTTAGPRVRLWIEARRGGYAGRVLREAARAQLQALGLFRRELSLAIVGDATIRALNLRFRGKDRATDVLAFPLQEGRSAGDPIGDVAVSLDAARRQAQEGGWPLAVELRRLLAHGLLHCLGHDHETPSQARRMARAELRLLGRRGLV